MKAVLIAAGRGTRLWEKTFRLPKTLLPFGEETILSQILKNFGSIGISDFVLVIGFRARLIREYLGEHNYFGFHVTFVENREWRRGNGLSVYAARARIKEDEQFVLSMSDHLVSPKALEEIYTATSDKNLLLVDPRLNIVYDLEDATKVLFRKSRILSIGKKLDDYNGIDCGIFRLNHSFFRAAARQIPLGKESVSEAVEVLIDENHVAPVIIPEHCFWIDIDTPASYQDALAFKEKFV
ncbi:MAG: NTP transferase domain-containing protein [Gemmatimonadota bacterium]|nr:MAG: NTP transferase domain-containing protein [Gemmatimonadota bacterium]